MFGECLNLAVFLLNKNKEFYPFALTLSKSNDIAIVGTYDGRERPLSEEVISDLKAALLQSRDEIKVAAIVDDVKVDRRYDAIRARVEHCEGTAYEIIAPYEMKGIFKKAKLIMETSSISHTDKYVWKDSE